MELFRFSGGAEDVVPLRVMNCEEWKKYPKSAYLENVTSIQPFSGKGHQILLETDENGKLKRVFAGTSFEETDPRNWVILFAKLAKTVPQGNYAPENLPDSRLYDAMLGWGLGKYQFDRYTSKKSESRKKTLVIPETAPVAKINHSLASIFLGRDLINTPANAMTPAVLVKEIRDLAEKHQATVKSIEGSNLLLEGFPTVYAVGKGSQHPPALVEFTWGDANHPKVTLIGKGVVFDTGGLNLKPATGMRDMKKDMGGAAVAIALAQLIVLEKLPVFLRLVVPAVENSPGGGAYRPGDIIKTRKGLQIEIGNTDAEGRLILCDALALCLEDKPDLLIDFATLTGSARVALGEDLPACYSPDNALMRELITASEQIGEPVWHMPLWEPYRKFLNSEVADMDNMANTPLAGSITASLFLWEFVKPFRNWIHIDMFGWRNTALPGYPKGGEASALRAVYQFLENRYSEK